MIMTIVATQMISDDADSFSDDDNNDSACLQSSLVADG